MANFVKSAQIFIGDTLRQLEPNQTSPQELDPGRSLNDPDHLLRLHIGRSDRLRRIPSYQWREDRISDFGGGRTSCPCCARRRLGENWFGGMSY